MKRRKLFGSLTLLVLGTSLAVGSSAFAGDVKAGDKLPAFTLKDLDGKEHKLADFQGKVLVLDFCSQHCPWSRGADPDLVAVVKKYQEKGVVFLGIDSHRDTSVENISAYVKEKGISMPILKDTGNEYADAVGAERTPELFVVGKDGVVKYHGAFDNRRAPDKKGDVNYLTQALDAVLAGETVPNPSVAAWGCSIKRVKG
jgi:peroxiredoxin